MIARLSESGIRPLPGIPFLILAACLPVLLVGLCATSSAQEEADPQAAAQPNAEPAHGGDRNPANRVGRLIKISLPITSKTYGQVQRFAVKAMDAALSSGSHPVLIFEFQIPPDQAESAASTKFGDAWELASWLSGGKLNAATTVAYIPEAIQIQGHAVLVVLACDQIVMAPDAEIGSAGVNERTIAPEILNAYQQFGSRRPTDMSEVAMGLVDATRKVLDVKTDIGRDFVSPDGLEKLRRERTIISSETIFEAGQPGRLSGDEARDLELVSCKSSDRIGLAHGLELRPGEIEEDPSLTESWKAIRVDLKGPINAGLVAGIQKMIDDAVYQDDVNFICLWIDSPGGSAADSLQLATYLAFDLDPSRVRTVAYIPTQALADASIVATACDQVVMHPRAKLGGAGSPNFTEEEIDHARQTIREAIAPEKSRSWSLPVAMIDPELSVYRYRYSKLGDLEYFEFFSEEEASEQLDPENWRKEPRQITRLDRPFQAKGEEAIDLWLADHTVKSFHEFKELYGLEDDPRLAEPDWASFLVDALATDGAAIFLLIIGFVAVYSELHAPGFGIGAFVAAMCFLLFFWSRFLGGSAGWLEVSLFIAGISCMLLEVFVLPGFGVFGLGGGMLVIISIVLASQTFIWPRNEYHFHELQRSLTVLGGAAVGTVALAVLLNRWLPKVPLFGQMLLQPPEGEAAEDLSRRESLVDFSDLLGTSGTTLTPLMPSGKARFGDRRVDVVTDGEYIGRGMEVVVAEVHGNRVVVRAAEELS